MRRVLISASLATVVATAAQAFTLPTSFVDFEVMPDGTPPKEGTVEQPLVYEFPSTSGTSTVTFTASVPSGAQSDLGIARVGVPDGGLPFGFWPDDMPIPSGAFGDFFLTTGLAVESNLEITYFEPVQALNFDLGDVDGVFRLDGSPELPGRVEVFTVQTRNADGDVLDEVTVRGDDPNAGDQSVVNVSFQRQTADIKSILIVGTTAGGVREIGIAFDNFDPDDASIVPVPPSLPLAAIGIAALGVLRLRSKAS